jgi:hypothetical protein
MPAPRDIVDALESVTSIYFSDVRHRVRATFILTDELVEVCCKCLAVAANPNIVDIADIVDIEESVSYRLHWA